ncbi:MAG: two-component regulator propeller domain-containing protein [Verrucomicrobiota bacterium]
MFTPWPVLRKQAQYFRLRPLRLAQWLALKNSPALIWSILVLFIFASGSGVPAAESEVPGNLDLPNYFLRTWSTDEGLPANAVTAIVQTHDGYLWIGTYGGLARFDGVRFTVFNSANDPALQSDRVTSLFEDASNTLWIGHERGDLTCYRNGKFEAQEVHESGIRRKISAIGSDKNGDIWMLNEEGTMVRARDGATCALPNNDGVVQMIQDFQGTLWVASGGNLAPLQNGQLVPINQAEYDPNKISGYIEGICPSRDGGIWIVSDHSIKKWDGRAWSEDRGTNPYNAKVTAMLETKSGCLAMGTVDRGLNVLFPDRQMLHFNHANGFALDWIRCLCEDREGTLWIGAGSEGIGALRPGKVVTMGPPDHWAECVALSTTTARDGSLWVGTEGAGLYRFDDGTWENFGSSAGLSNLFVWCVSEDSQGRMWAGTWGGGIFRQEGDHFVVPPGLENVNVPMPALLQASNGVTWIGTASGLIRYENGKVSRFGEKDGLKVPDVRAIVEAQDGTVWFGMLGGGLGCLQNGHLKQYLKSDGLPSDDVQCLYLETDGTLWIGTYGSGLSRFKNGHFDKVTSAEGLPNNFICAMVEDDQANFWISSSGGIFRVSRQILDDCADGKSTLQHCLVYGKGDGMLSLECSGGLQPAACRVADGRICFPTSRGIVMVNPTDTKINHVQPPVVIEEVVANGNLLAGYPRSPEPLRIAPGLQRFEFHYTGLSFIAPEKMKFQYRLEGWEKDWQDGGSERFAKYSYIPPGDYTFQVRACNSDGIWNQGGASLAFILLPYFWQTWWFHTLTILAGVAAIAGTVLAIARRRMHRKLEIIQRQQAIERERTRIAKDIHDHLGANLTRISLLSQSAHGELENPVQAAVQLERIYDTARELTRSMDEIVWAVNPQHDTLDSLASYLGNFAQDYLALINIRCRLEVPLHLPQWPITAEVRHDVFLAFKEAVHNIVKHSGATEVTVFLATGISDFTLILRDNGRGFDPTALPERAGRGNSCGNGLKNMRQRMEKIGGRCDINSAPGRGVEIEFTVRLPERI